MASGPGRFLVVDDDPARLRMWSVMLTTLGHEVEAVSDGTLALESFIRNAPEVVVTDVSMPGMSGLDLLQQIRQHDADVPVIVITGAPELTGVTTAVEFHAFRYLSKPVTMDAFREVARQALEACRTARARRVTLEKAGATSSTVRQRSLLAPRFDTALDKLWMAYQPIVQWSTRRVYAYEALVRSGHAEMADPGSLFDAAEQLDRSGDLEREIRRLTPQPIARTDAFLFINMSTNDLLEQTPLHPGSPLAGIESRIVLEITERASLDTVSDARALAGRLRERGFRIALDDVGSGYSNLKSFEVLNPDVVKLDMALVRDVHKSDTKQAVVRSMVSLCQDMGAIVVAEGVENTSECIALLSLGCDCFQGFMFARPGPAFPDVNWDSESEILDRFPHTALP